MRLLKDMFIKNPLLIKEWLTYSGTDRPGELCYNFSISINLTEMVNFTTQISGCDSHSPPLLDFLF